jgi:ubiquinol-cytochrome c reductase iron-sulfur subunit
MKRLSLLKIAILGALGFARGAGRRAYRRIVPEGEPNRRAELAVILLFLASAACAVMFVLVYALDWRHQTQLLGLSLGVALGLLAIALIVIGKRLVVTEHLEEDYPAEEEPAEQLELVQVVRESGSRITRKRLFAAAAGTAGAALGAALISPVASLGPALDPESLYDSPWRRGRRLVDEDGKPYAASDIEQETFYTAFPEHADEEELGAPLVVVRLHPASIHLPAGRTHWAPQGILAYSKICTHAGCAVALYRKPLFPAVESRPALVCPCHYSTFDPAKGAEVIFGPAGRPLPQLPLLIDNAGDLRAAGNFSGPVGPAFWGVRTRKPRST